MYIEEIIDAFTLPNGFPREAIAAATERREEVLPRFLKELEEFADGVEEPEVPTPVFTIVHLLASWGETSAYRAVARAFAVDEERAAFAFGDTTTETSHRVILRLFDGDPRPLYDIIEAPAAEPWIRSRMLEALAVLAHRGALPRDEVVAYLRGAPDRLEPKEEDVLWVGWQSAVAMLGVAELEDRVRRAFDDGWIGPDIMRFENFQEDLRRIQADPDDERVMRGDEFSPFGDIEAEMGSWAWDWGIDDDLVDEDFLDEDLFDDDALEKRMLARLGAEDRKRLEEITQRMAADMGVNLPQEPAVNPYRHVGRNDPCPCGSGKKFKKCCGAAA